MSDLAIKVEGLGKQYRIGAKHDEYATLRDVVSGALLSPFRRAKALLSGQAYGAAGLNETIWALRGVNFEVKEGEVVAVIGHNGAGKSTLLKVLSRITEPSEGYADVYGRVGSLLEVGTGFHPELTGRENIYLNGAILGMHRDEIDAKFDEMVAFAETEKFIDTPVKHYSSGMHLRLAFSVAAHLEPEILLVDEVLAVGDVKFQNKCIGKMSDVASEGRTVLFVSHNMVAARTLCQRGIVLERGQVVYQGGINEAIDYYIRDSASQEHGIGVRNLRDITTRTGIGGGKVVAIGSRDNEGNETSMIGVGKPFELWADLELEQDMSELVMGFEIRGMDGTPLVNLRSDAQSQVFDMTGGKRRVRIKIDVPSLNFYPGIYLVEPWFCQRLGRRVDHVHRAFSVTLESHGVLESERFYVREKGMVMMDVGWSAVDFQTSGVR
jgi:lipopolysaccharide transport system ATP-binding protein